MATVSEVWLRLVMRGVERLRGEAGHGWRTWAASRAGLSSQGQHPKSVTRKPRRVPSHCAFLWHCDFVTAITRLLLAAASSAAACKPS